MTAGQKIGVVREALKKIDEIGMDSLHAFGKNDEGEKILRELDYSLSEQGRKTSKDTAPNN